MAHAKFPAYFLAFLVSNFPVENPILATIANKGKGESLDQTMFDRHLRLINILSAFFSTPV